MAESKEQWVQRVLGVKFDSKARAANSLLLLPVWQRAKDTVDSQLNSLAAGFRDAAHPLAEAIAEQGLPVLTGRTFVGLTAALFDYDAATVGTRDAAARNVREKLTAFRAELANNRLWAVLERNPLGITVSLRPPIQRSLDEIESALG